MTVDTLITVILVAWALGLFTIGDIVNGLKQIKSVRYEMTTIDGSETKKKKKQWSDEDIREALGKMDKDELQKRYDDGKYSGKWKDIAKELLKQDKSDV